MQGDIDKLNKRINELVGVKESDTGLSPPAQWDLVSDKQMMQEEQPLQVARCTKIINPNTDDAKYVINVKQIAKFVVGLGDRVAPADIEEGMRVGVDRNKYQIQIPLPPKIVRRHPPRAATLGHHRARPRCPPRLLLPPSPARPVLARCPGLYHCPS